ncbi:RNA-binding protein, putative [Plasmodium yoelii]|uniref:RNA-binding protein, putative n=1 Tax=Plasmodium yoelii TaxID=5861 RepID=A0A077Y2G6_PLAYE|nr:RNA-binding protein, putative [Plasmodium yoelii]CDU17301.1 RNA-binding protein, putative [Plasmodium yoelii]VTZ76540.1 RNA-binding protein, putative [Plasmodium yoelii]|eukprot:XP_022811831.1 RNA-binding protein, putative [Plasmodium yoelii]
MSSKMETPKDLSEMTDSDFSNIEDKTDDKNEPSEQNEKNEPNEPSEKNEDEKKNKKKISLKKPKKKSSISSKTSQKNNKKVIQNKTKKKTNGLLACPPPPTHPPPPPPPPFIPKEKQQNWKLKKKTNNSDINNDIISITTYPANSNNNNNNNNNNPHYRINEPHMYNKSLSIPSIPGPTPPYPSNIYNHPVSNINSPPCTNTNIKVNLQTNHNYNNNFKKNYKINNIPESESYVMTSPTLISSSAQQTNTPMNIHVDRKHTLISNNSITQNKDYPYIDIQHNNNNMLSFPSSPKQPYSNISIPPNPNYYSPNNLRPTDYIEDKIYYPNYQNNIDHNNTPKYYQPVVNAWNGAAPPPIPNNPYQGNPKFSPHDYNPEKMNYKDKPIRMDNAPYDPKPHNIIITNIPKNLTSRDIMETFKCMGNVLGAGIMMTSKGEHSGCAYVTFPNIEIAALAASRYDGGTLNNQKIKVFIE